MANRQQLNQQADLIEAVLAKASIQAAVTGGNVTPRWIQFLLQPAPNVKVNRVEALSREIAIALGAASVKVSTNGGAIRIDVPRSAPQPVSLAAMMRRLPRERIPLYTAVLGIAENGAPLLVRLAAPDVCHVLITGGHGMGKTSLATTMIVSLAATHERRLLKVILIGSALSGLASLPHVLPFGDGLGVALQLVKRRESLPNVTPRVIVVIDELPQLNETQRAIVNTLIERGHGVGVHIIGVTDQPEPIAWPTMITADHQPGDFWAEHKTIGQVIRFDAARVLRTEINALIKR